MGSFRFLGLSIWYSLSLLRCSSQLLLSLYPYHLYFAFLKPHTPMSLSSLSPRAFFRSFSLLYFSCFSIYLFSSLCLLTPWSFGASFSLTSHLTPLVFCFLLLSISLTFLSSLPLHCSRSTLAIPPLFTVVSFWLSFSSRLLLDVNRLPTRSESHESVGKKAEEPKRKRVPTRLV